MVRQGPVVSPRHVRVAALLIKVCFAIGVVLGTLVPNAGLAAAEAGGPKAEPIDRQPYRIQVHLGTDPETRIDRRRREALTADWLALVDRFVGTPWDVAVAEPGSALANLPLESLDAAAFAENKADGFDKVWVLQVGREGAGFSLSGREFDAATGRVRTHSTAFEPVRPRRPPRALPART